MPSETSTRPSPASLPRMLPRHLWSTTSSATQSTRPHGPHYCRAPRRTTLPPRLATTTRHAADNPALDTTRRAPEHLRLSACEQRPPATRPHPTRTRVRRPPQVATLNRHRLLPSGLGARGPMTGLIDRLSVRSASGRGRQPGEELNGGSVGLEHVRSGFVLGDGASVPGARV